MSRQAKASKARIRIALAKAKEIVRRQKDLDTCLDVAQRVALAASLADDYGALMAEYPDVFPAPPVHPDHLREHTRELREAQAAAEKEDAEREEASRKLRVALNEATRAPERPQKPS